jgi:stage II sporulation protein D
MTVLIAVFGLFHPQVLTVRPATQSPVRIESPKRQALSDRIEIRTDAKLEGDFILAVPGRIERRFQGVLQIRKRDTELVAVLSVDLESAVAAAVAAEMPASYPLEARKAQAIAARSWYAASRGRHGDYDFCDTTHCQVLKEAGTLQSSPLVLHYRGEPFAPLYSASCGGSTLSAEAAGMNGEPYPYFRVACEEHAPEWERRFAGKDAAAIESRPHSETIRILLGRALGWDALPGNSYTIMRRQSEIVLRGRGRGHGLGLCQQGAATMALRGTAAADILAHYFPNTTLRAMR